MSTLLEVSHQTLYAYAAPVALAHHLAHLQPIDDAHQQLLSFGLMIEPKPDHERSSVDSRGNAERRFSLAQPHRQLEVRATSRLRVADRFAELRAEQSPPWEALADRLRYTAGRPFEPQVEFALPSPYAPRLAVLGDYAAASFTPGRPVAAAALALMRRIYTDFAFDADSTNIDTPLEAVWASKRGVCQDFAHLTAAAMRMLGLPVRYVSGYLLTHALGSDVAMLGTDASHAWVQAWCPGTPGVPEDGWLDLDPTNDVVPGSGHVRLAVGRDFGDVTPLRGVIRGSGSATLKVAVATRVLESQATPPRVNPKENAAL